MVNSGINGAWQLEQLPNIKYPSKKSEPLKRNLPFSFSLSNFYHCHYGTKTLSFMSMRPPIWTLNLIKDPVTRQLKTNTKIICLKKFLFAVFCFSCSTFLCVTKSWSFGLICILFSFCVIGTFLPHMHLGGGEKWKKRVFKSSRGGLQKYGKWTCMSKIDFPGVLHKKGHNC